RSRSSSLYFFGAAMLRILHGIRACTRPGAHHFNERFGPFELLPVPQAMLDKVAVVPDAQGRGVGRLLVREFAAGMSSRGCTHVALMVDQSTPWEGRVKFFASCGFRSLIEGSDDDLLGAEITALRGVTAP
ncbi:GNAT family N-acetyltransferase, partial [Amycolatopsis sp. NPDC023774]|uniref:GNAT family N-acetyltransferase n=1 Tax=Amycolatopsis sp. NPDC023774 TaxID=3155015 RepID=UPI0033DD862C